MRLLKINGEWVSNPHVLHGHISNYFEVLFGTTEVDLDVMTFSFEGHGIDNNRVVALMRQASREEVKKAVFGMKRFDSPGYVGSKQSFTSIFGIWWANP